MSEKKKNRTKKKHPWPMPDTLSSSTLLADGWKPPAQLGIWRCLQTLRYLTRCFQKQAIESAVYFFAQELNKHLV